MGILQTLGFAAPAQESAPQAPAATEQLQSTRMQVELLQERLADLQREDRGWEALAYTHAQDITRDGLTRNADLVRIMSIMNPLMKRGKTVRAEYVFGQGVAIAARANTAEEGQNVDEVLQAFLDDEGNRVAVFGQQACIARENDLFDDGNVFTAFFTNPMDGRVQVRPLPFDQIVEIITDPDDAFTPWYYKRQWLETVPSQTFGATGLTRQRTAYYPDLRFQPLTKPRRLGEHEVMWASPVYHMKVNAIGRTRQWGLGDGFAAMPWARGYKEFLEDWALLMKALARISWQVKNKNGAASQALRGAAQAVSGGPAGQVAYMGDTTLEAPAKSGATIDADSSRPLATMVAAALGITNTILLADPGISGARAVAETLDQPMRLTMENRQEVHAEFYRAAATYVIEQAVLAPRGKLRGREVRDGNRLHVELANNTDDSIEVTFPSLEELDVKLLVDAIVAADSTGKMPPMEVVKLLLRAFQIEDIEELLEDMQDADGNFVPPQTTVDQAAGNAATAKLRQGDDPAEAL